MRNWKERLEVLLNKIIAKEVAHERSFDEQYAIDRLIEKERTLAQIKVLRDLERACRGNQAGPTIYCESVVDESEELEKLKTLTTK